MAAAMSWTWWPAPAKLNLFLHVVRRRSDGYHDLQTLFQLIDLVDLVGVEPRADGLIVRVQGLEGLPFDEDLAVRAARLLKTVTGCQLGVNIAIRKRIPVGGGLGGGSSDAATILLVLNRLWQLGLGLDDLASLGLRLGADVPVFLHGSSAWAEGRGDLLEPVQLPPRWYLIICPKVAVSTAEIFQAPELTRNSPLITIRAFFQAGSRNDCEPIVRRRYPEVDAAFRWLARHAEARMSGTGACIFAAFDNAEEIERVAAGVPDEWLHYIARGLDRSPLHGALATTTQVWAGY
jgi:4-diphosphocytidyl-2-C-methyl-D-erythritol kinase